MATTTLDQIRQCGEDLETLEKSVSKLLGEKAAGKKSLVVDHLVKKMIGRMQEKSEKMLELYADKDGLRKDEIAVLGGSRKVKGMADDLMGNGTSADKQQTRDVGVWINFYDKMKEIKDYTRRNAALNYELNYPEPNQDTEFCVSEMIKFETPQVEALFCGEEDMGRRVDLQNVFDMYVNWGKYKAYRAQEHRQSEIARLKKKQSATVAAKKAKNDEDEKQSVDLGASQEGDCPSGGDASGDKASRKLKKSLAGLSIADNKEFQKQLEFQEIDYITYLKSFDRFHEIPRYFKYREPSYKNYIEELLKYLSSHFRKQNPLIEEEKVLSQFEFDHRWQEGTIQGWTTYTHKLPLYSMAVDRLFASDSTFSSHQTGKRYQKCLAVLQARSLEEQKQLIDASEQHDEELAKCECLIQFYKDLLSSTIERTVEHLQKKQSRSIREILNESASAQAETEEADNQKTVLEEESDEDASDEEDKLIYNPLNLPLGWDGKPIPFWLYKLHGLGQEYKCEICGNYSYWGRRAFERHFQEWRHAYGMRCLKIPNTVHFKEVTKIEDAITLFEKLKHQAEIHTFIAEQDAECEDSDGNVMSAKAYDDLRRQGLL